MARIRSVHPSLWTDDAFVAVSTKARLLWIGIWTESDDKGVFEWKPLSLKMRLLPADTADVPALLEELVGAGLVRPYSIAGRNYGAVRNFQKYQRPKKPNDLHPVPAEMRSYLGSRAPNGEPDTDEGDENSSPVPHQTHSNGDRSGTGSSPILHRFPTDGENSAQMEDEGWRMEDGTQPPSESDAHSATPVTKRGSRLQSDWQPSMDDRDFAQSLGLDADAVAAGFRDYWIAKAGRDAAKLDWSATFRNWCRRDAEKRQRPSRMLAPRDDAHARRSAAFDAIAEMEGLKVP